MSYLMKSCNEGHLIDRTGYVRLGTLAYFRSLKLNEIGDNSEAALQARVVIDRPITYPNGLLSSVMTGAMQLGAPSKTLRRPFGFLPKELSFGRMGPKGGEVLKCDFRYETFGSNALIFCMTMVKNKDEKPDLGYDCSWKIERHHASRFGQKILRTLNRLWMEEPGSFVDVGEGQGEELIKNAQFQMKHAPVRYQRRRVEVRNPSVRELKNVARLLQNADMYKADSYAHQREYRFCFRLVSGRALVSLKAGLDYIQIDADEFRRFGLC